MSRLLCIDWDFWFYNPLEAGNTADPTIRLFDWGHNESPIFLSNMIWETRAAGFFQHDLPLPQVTTPPGGWETFWGRFTFSDDPWFGYADSNALAGLVPVPDEAPAFEEIVLFDAHHDSGYHVKSFADYLARDRFSCEDWLLEHQKQGTQDITVRYPTWKPDGPSETLPAGAVTRLMLDDGLPLDTVFDAIFVCRSGAWVPPWCDPAFLDFIDAAPHPGVQVDDADLDREFTESDARIAADQMRALLASMDPDTRII